MPFADGAFGLVLCVDALLHLKDRFAAIRDRARVLRPGGRLLFAAVLTGLASTEELSARSSQGAFLLAPPGLNEAALEAAGLALLSREDRTPVEAAIAARLSQARERRSAVLRVSEGDAFFERRQAFLSVTGELAASGRLSRFVYLAEKP